MGLPGNHGIIQRLGEEQYVALYRYAYRVSGAAVEGRDLTPATVCRAQAQWSQPRDVARAKAWLCSILRNAYLHGQRSLRQNRQVPLDCVGDLAEPAPEPLPDVDPEQLQKALDELPEVFRTPVILYY